MRSLPVIASVVLHAGIGVGLVASAGGHARSRASLPVATLDIDVEANEAPVSAPVDPPVAPVAAPPPLAHHHPYPVAASHDAHPHDPALHHAEEEAAPAAAAPAPAAAVLVAAGASLPRFTMASGSGAPRGAHVAANAAGSGAGSRDGDGAGRGDDTIHGASAVQVGARLVTSITAAYPTHARADELEGDVGVEIVVDREGRVVDARVVRPAGHGFDRAALAAVRGYRFSPAQREGRAVRVRMPWSVQFRLR